MATRHFQAQASGSDSPFGDERLAGIATGLADQFGLLYEVTPADPQAHMAGNMLAISFRGGLSPSDEKHLEAGHLDEVRQFRERFTEVVAEELKNAVRALTRAEVTFFSSVFDPQSRTTNMLFVLDLLPDDETEQRAAIRNWSEQVRRNARELRISHLQTRETHLVLRGQMEDLRHLADADRDRRGEGSGQD
jgi:uncharacterized protein YbcI